jgi:hypothetical protein
VTRLVRSALLLACAPLAACGFLGFDGFDGTPVADGLAPFGPDEAVTLCVEGARIAQTTRPPGLCRAEGHESAACETDAECVAPEACVCGKCTAKLCDFSSECPEGTVCSGSPRRCLLRCTEDEECGHLGVCESGTCLRACADQAECAVGELCLAARCRAIACGPSGPNCGPGEVCAHQLLAAEASGPSALSDDDGQVVLFVGLVEDGSVESAIYRFVSSDGVAFVAYPAEPVLLPADGAIAFTAPSAIRTETGLRLYYEVDGGDAIALAIDPSGAGASFGPGQTVLVPTEAWEGGRVGSPGAVEIDGEVLLTYEGGDGAGIGFALESGGAVANAQTPSLVPADLEDPVRFSDVTAVGDPFVYIFEGESGRRVLRLYVGAMGIAQPASPGGTFDEANLSIAVAGAMLDGSADTLVLEAHTANPIYGRVQNFSPQDETGPSLIWHGGSYLLYIDTPEGIRVAANPAD